MGDVSAVWHPTRDRVDPAAFIAGRLGPYSLGELVRISAFGSVTMAINDAVEHVVEIEQFDGLRGSDLAGPDGRLLQDLAPCIGLAHRHVRPVIGAGMSDRVPYVVRPFRLGRTLREVLAQWTIIPESLAAAILFSVLEGLGFLHDAGPRSSACAMGGFDEDDIHLGFDGSIQLLGTGLKLARGPAADPVGADLQAARALAQRFDRACDTRLYPLSHTSTSVHDFSVKMRKAYREACGTRAHLVGAYFRQHFGDIIARERAYFGLTTLH